MNSVSLEDLGKLPGVSVAGTCDAHVAISDACIKSLAEGRARLKIVGLKPGNRVTLEMGDFSGEIVIALPGNGVTARWGDLRAVTIQATLYNGGTLDIGSLTSINGLVAGIFDSQIVIGRDCLLSHQIHMQPHNQHGIIDLKNKKLIEQKRGITIGNHVWIGHSAKFLPGAHVADGTIVGAHSVVTKAHLTPCCVLVGQPAHVIREDISWSRAIYDIDADTIDFMNSLEK